MATEPTDPSVSKTEAALVAATPVPTTPSTDATATTATTTTTTTSTKPKRIIRRRRRATAAAAYNVDPALLHRVVSASHLPPQYSFEIVKTVQRCVAVQATHIALQLPEGLLLYATVLADVLQQLTPQLQQVSVLGDVTYGACCVDDLTAQQLGCDLLVHYGHSCLVPMPHTVVPVLYVFVELHLSIAHLVETLCVTLVEQQRQQQQCSSTSSSSSTRGQPKHKTCHVYLMGTVQFRHALAIVREEVLARMTTAATTAAKEDGDDCPTIYDIVIPQVKPLSPGEVLGCTSPVLPHHPTANHNEDSTTSFSSSIVCFVADGRFHLESTLISNPHIDTFYRYDPYSKTMTTEAYEHVAMKELRHTAIQQARHAQTFGILLGTLGRQGNPAIVQRIRSALSRQGRRHVLVLLSEITPAKLQCLAGGGRRSSSSDTDNTNNNNGSGTIDCWVQVACPRLSVDWGHALSGTDGIPVLNPYELFVCLEETEWRDAYPMDYYAMSGGPWTNYHGENKDRRLGVERETMVTNEFSSLSLSTKSLCECKTAETKPQQ